MSATKIHLLVIDPQNDFVSKTGNLSVVGAAADMDRVASMMRRIGPKLGDVHFTLDSHRKVDISHPMWWKNPAGQRPSPFTMISVADVENGVWTTTQPGAYKRSLAYVRALAATGRYPHVVWPEHCLIGDAGHNVWPLLAEAAHDWEFSQHGMVDFVTKGSNPWTEHFSAVQAEVPDPADPSTQVNTGLIRTLEEADIILLAGEALSHCVANTVRDIVTNFSDPRYAQKLVLLTDACSCVANPPGTTLFTDMATAFLRDMKAMGMKTSTTDSFLA
ncbi:MAG: isochorismatase family protein [Myxococcales bacterium]|nr:isochorismatase family protein [Myxococcales bacterium]